ncbi:MAG: tetratricopeptide repeat protein [Phototrophicaceae bacterium]
MLIRTNHIQKEQLWGVVAAQALLLMIGSLFLLRACTTSANRNFQNQTLTLQSESALQQDVLITQAENRIASNNIAGGIALLDVTIQQGQPSARVFGARAAAFARIGDFANAITDYQQAVALAPDNTDYQFGLCFMHVQTADYLSAVTACSHTIQLMPSHFMAWNNRCYVRSYHTGDYAGGISDCTQAIALNSSHPYPYNNRSRAYLMSAQYQQAINDATQSILLGNTHQYLPLTNRGTAYLAMGNGAAALQDFQAAITANPNYDEVYARLGELYRWQNQSALARQAYCQYLTVTSTPIALIVERVNELGGCG